MERKINYQITAEDAGLRAEQYLRRKGYSYQNLTQLKKMPESLLINGVWSYMRTPLAAGDILTVHIRENESSPNIPAVPLPLDIVYEDEDIIIVNKPAGMPTHPSLNNYRNSLANALMYYFEQQKKPFIFRCTNRLDRDTSGLTVIAKHLVSSSILSGMAVRHEIEREYLALVRGSIRPLLPERSAHRSEEPELPLSSGKSILKMGKPRSLISGKSKKKTGTAPVSLILETGRTHQIRVHMKCIGYPLIGDDPYNTGHGIYSTARLLHSYRLSFRHPITGEQMEFTAPLPEDMGRVMNPDFC